MINLIFQQTQIESAKVSSRSGFTWNFSSLEILGRAELYMKLRNQPCENLLIIKDGNGSYEAE